MKILAGGGTGHRYFFFLSSPGDSDMESNLRDTDLEIGAMRKDG